MIRSARYSVVSLLIGTLPILLLDQGRDLLLGLADPSGGRHQTWFVIWSVVWAFSVWYWSRVLLDAEGGEHPSTLYQDWATWLPRVAGFLTLFVPGLACLMAASDATASRGSADPRWRRRASCSSLLFGAYVIVRQAEFRDWAARPPTATRSTEMATPSIVVFVLSAVLSAVMFAWLTLFALDAGHRFGAVAILAIVGANTVFLGGHRGVRDARAAGAGRDRGLCVRGDLQRLERQPRRADAGSICRTRRRTSGSERGVFVVGDARAG